MVLTLPYPPSVNHYWLRNRNGSVRIGKAGLQFREEVWLRCRQERIRRAVGRLQLSVTAFPPDARRRDLDNTLKAVCDALQHGGAYEDDSQIDRLIVQRGQIVKGGRLEVTLTPYTHPAA